MISFRFELDMSLKNAADSVLLPGRTGTGQDFMTSANQLNQTERDECSNLLSQIKGQL